MSVITSYPSRIAKNHFGDCLVASRSLAVGTIVQRFQTAPTDKTFNGAHDAPLDERHVIVIGEEDGKLLYGRVISNARYINHSCNPNCKVSSEKEVITIRTVAEQEELTIAYDDGSGEWKPEWNFQCLCHAENCRRFIDRYTQTTS